METPSIMSSNNNDANDDQEATSRRNRGENRGGDRRRRQERERNESSSEERPPRQQPWWKLYLFLILLALDSISSLLLLTPLIPKIQQVEDLTPSHYSLHGTLWDLSLLSIPRILSALMAVLVAYYRRDTDSQGRPAVASTSSSSSLYHPNGDKKSKAELEEEALEEPFGPMIRRFACRIPFVTEISVLCTGLCIGVKCLTRLNVEIGIFNDAQPQHPVFWLALALTATFALLETSYTETMEALAGKLGYQRRQELAAEPQQQQQPENDVSSIPHSISSSWLERMGETLTQPLLPRTHSSVSANTNVSTANDMEEGAAGGGAGSTHGNDKHQPQNGSAADHEQHRRAKSDIGADAVYSASWTDLMAFAKPDTYLICMASLFLVASAVANVYVPKYTGDVLDTLVSGNNNGGGGNDDDDSPNIDYSFGGDSSSSMILRFLNVQAGKSITQIPGFVPKIEMLVLVSILAGVFGGIRGAIFTLVGARVNTRLRIRLMDALLSQDIGFYDTTRTGDITSRLSSDTTLVGSSITTNLNIFLRSTVRGAGVLIFMFTISWQLSLLAFITIPAVTVLSKWYGRYIRKLSKLQQKKLADGNSVSESAISSMATVRAFGAERVELTDFEECMQKYLDLNIRAAIATLGYSTCVNALPQLVKALVLFYGGLLVQSDGPGHITGGQLVSFLLYLTSLSDAFGSLGGIYASLVRAVGAADKVFELMNRKPRLTTPSHVDEERLERALEQRKKHLLGVDVTQVAEQRARGLYPESCQGLITLENVNFRYPARPQRIILKQMNMTIPAGSIVAIVGASGGGKSSVVSLIQHLYEANDGKVCIDGIPVEELSADWLCKHVAVVAQEPTLFSRSVKRNIIYGLEGTDSEPSLEEIKQAARQANAAPFIEAFPAGYDTEVGERGIQLSGGQKQRVAIARALVRRPKILLLDEATSALDSESEFVVQKAIDDMISGQRSLEGDPSRSMTVVIVAHRLSTVRNADCIFCVQDGRVVEQGSHEQLAAMTHGVYSGLIRRQLGQMMSDSS